tara:strand:+ start:4443 stop:4571 length:129 start_codon:yes stop_codon:yes gene_type:complete
MTIKNEASIFSFEIVFIVDIVIFMSDKFFWCVSKNLGPNGEF